MQGTCGCLKNPRRLCAPCGRNTQAWERSSRHCGWTGPNPHHYTTSHHIHSQFETEFVNDNISMAEVRHYMKPLAPIHDEWTDYLAYLHHTHGYVDEVYQLWNEHGFEGAGTPASRAFTARRLASGADMLRNLIVAAWVKSAEPVPEWRPHQAN